MGTVRLRQLVGLACAVALVVAIGQPLAASPQLRSGSWPKPIYHLQDPEGVDTDLSGNIYVADTGNNRIVKFGPSGGREVFGGAGASAGRFDHPSDVAVTPDGKFVYVADTGNHRIQKLTADGVHVVSWGREGGPDARGSGIKEFDSPKSLCVDSQGYVYIADTGNERIQMLTPEGVFVLQWGEPGSTVGQFYEPTGIECAPTGEIFVVDHDLTNAYVQEFAITKLSPTEATEKFVGRFGYSVRATPPGLFSKPRGIAIDRDGDVYVRDYAAYAPAIRKFTPVGTHNDRTYVLRKSWAMKGFGDGTQTAPLMYGPTGLCILTQGAAQVLLVCDTRNDRLREFSTEGVTMGVRGSWGISPGRFNQASGVAIDAAGNVFVSSQSKDANGFLANHRIQKFDSTGTVLGYLPAGIPALAGDRNGQFKEAAAVAVDDLGDVYVAESGNHRIQKLTGGLAYITKWGELGTHQDRFNSPSGIAFGVVDGIRRVFVADTKNSRVLVFPLNGGWPDDNWGTRGSGKGQFRDPQGIAVSRSGIVYVADTGNHRVQYFNGDGTYLGQWGSFGNDATHFRSPQGIAVSALGQVYVADTGNDRIKRFDADGTPLGACGTTGADPGEFLGPRGLAFGPDGTLYVADTGNHRVQFLPPDLATSEIQLNGSPAVTAYGGTFSMNARLRSPQGQSVLGRPLALYRSYNGDDWSFVTMVMPSDSGEYSYTARLYRTTYFKWSLEDAAGLGDADAMAFATSRASLSAPGIKSRTMRGYPTIVRGTLKPRHPAKSQSIKVLGYKRFGSRWVLKINTGLRVADYRSVSNYTGYLYFPSTGNWRICAVHADADHAMTRSAYTYVTVR